MRVQSLSCDPTALTLDPDHQTLSLQFKDMPLKHLKAVMRTTSIPINDDSRHRLWLELAIRHSGHSAPDSQFDADLEAVNSQKLPHFVDPRIARFFALNGSGKQDVSTVLWNLSQSCPHLTLAPLVYPLTSLFLHFHEPQDTYKALYSLLNSRDVHFMATTRADKARDAIILVKLTNKFGILRPRKFGADAREKLRNNALDAAFAEYLQWILWLPFHHCVRVVDCFLVEGEKFLFRVAITLALLFDKHRKQTITLERMRVFCETVPLSPSQLIASALRITRLSRKDIARAKTKAEMRSERVSFSESPIHTKPDMISTKDYILGARIAPRRFKSSVLNWTDLDTLWEWLPERVVVREPAVVFCSAENGNSLQTFYTLCGDYEPTVLLIKTINSQIFGAFCSSSWSKRLDLAQTRSGQYFGTGETFLFVLAPEVRKYDWVGKVSADGDHCPHVTHSQQLFMCASSRSLVIGSGGGKFGLFIDESLTRGQSDRCDTFANQSLSSDSAHFDISVLEVIAFC